MNVRTGTGPLPMDEAIAKASQVGLLPPGVQAREAAVLVRCPRKPELLARVFSFSGALVLVPLGDVFDVDTWGPPLPWPVPGDDAELRIRGRCCAREHVVEAAAVRAAAATQLSTTRRARRGAVTITTVR